MEGRGVKDFIFQKASSFRTRCGVYALYFCGL